MDAPLIGRLTRGTPDPTQWGPMFPTYPSPCFLCLLLRLLLRSTAPRGTSLNMHTKTIASLLPGSAADSARLLKSSCTKHHGIIQQIQHDSYTNRVYYAMRRCNIGATNNAKCNRAYIQYNKQRMQQMTTEHAGQFSLATRNTCNMQNATAYRSQFTFSNACNKLQPIWIINLIKQATHEHNATDSKEAVIKRGGREAGERREKSYDHLRSATMTTDAAAYTSCIRMLCGDDFCSALSKEPVPRFHWP